MYLFFIKNSKSLQNLSKIQNKSVNLQLISITNYCLCIRYNSSSKIQQLLFIYIMYDNYKNTY